MFIIPATTDLLGGGDLFGSTYFFFLFFLWSMLWVPLLWSVTGRCTVPAHIHAHLWRLWRGGCSVFSSGAKAPGSFSLFASGTWMFCDWAHCVSVCVCLTPCLCRYRSPAFHVQSWYDEVKDYTYPYPHECNPWCPERCSGPMCTHYTQVRQAITVKAGLGKVNGFRRDI